jgi:uncharacterized protein YjiS (DUF1127 family)
MRRRYLPILFRRVVATVALWLERSRQRRHLARLDYHMLRDIGLSHGAARGECDKRFWQV